MKKTILALAAAGLMPFVASAQSTTPVPPAPPLPSATTPPSGGTPPATRPAPTRFEPKMMYGDVARVISSKPVYERTSAAPRECRMEGTGYNSAASELPPCDKASTEGGRERVVAYDVTYQYMGRDFLIRMPYDPGEQMAVNVIVVPPAPAPDSRSNYRIPNTRGPY